MESIRRRISVVQVVNVREVMVEVVFGGLEVERRKVTTIARAV